MIPIILRRPFRVLHVEGLDIIQQLFQALLNPDHLLIAASGGLEMAFRVFGVFLEDLAFTLKVELFSGF
jgi:hypothetical protein